MNIDKSEVLRYLRYQSGTIDLFTDNLIDICIEEIQKESSFNYIYKTFKINIDNEYIQLEDSNLLFEGKDIYNHLKDCEKCVVMAGTLGVKIDRLIKYYSRIDMTKCLIIDACATAAIEELCNQVQAEIKINAQKQNFYITNRYSPGYGDFNIEIQSKILNVLNAQIQIGLTVTENYILVPRKSVTAVIGLSNHEVINKKPSCSSCNSQKTCMYAKEGDYCGIK